MDPNHTLTIVFYKNLFAVNPQMKEIFWRFNLFQTLEKIVAVMSPDIDLNESLKLLAERHRGRGIFNEDYDRIGVSIDFALRELSIVNEENIVAWNLAFATFAHAMKISGNTKDQSGGYQQEEVEEDDTSNLPKYKMEEIKEHNKQDDLWLLINGKVYDVTKFIPRHPGGDRIYLGAGKDATKLFNSLHSKHAKTIMKKFLIGTLENNNDNNNDNQD